VTGSVFAFILYIAIYMRNDLIEKWKLKKAIGYKYLEGDMEWNYENTLKYPFIVIWAGFFAGLFGIGGGIVKGPLMLYMGVHPQVASATCAGESPIYLPSLRPSLSLSFCFPLLDLV
jgi:hypothetical protein